MKIWFYLFCRNSGHPWWQGSRLHLRSAVHGVGWEPELVPWRQYQDTHHKSHQRPEGGWRFYREQQDARWEMLILLISACKMKSSGLILCLCHRDKRLPLRKPAWTERVSRQQDPLAPDWPRQWGNSVYFYYITSLFKVL